MFAYLGEYKTQMPLIALRFRVTETSLIMKFSSLWPMRHGSADSQETEHSTENLTAYFIRVKNMRLGAQMQLVDIERDENC